MQTQWDGWTRAKDKEDTKWSRRVGAFMGAKKNETNTTKQTKHPVVRRTTKKMLKRDATLQSRRRQSVDETVGSGDR